MFKICGGGAKSPLWQKIIANVMNLTLEIPKNEEGPGLGAAMLATVGCGEYASAAEACEKLVKTKAVIAPDPVLVEKYEECYQKFKKLYPAIKGVLGENQ